MEAQVRLGRRSSSLYIDAYQRDGGGVDGPTKNLIFAANGPKPELYSQMVAEDRRLRLDGYEVYRFGGYELTERPDAPTMVKQFFDKLADTEK